MCLGANYQLRAPSLVGKGNTHLSACRTLAVVAAAAAKVPVAVVATAVVVVVAVVAVAAVHWAAAMATAAGPLPQHHRRSWPPAHHHQWYPAMPVRLHTRHVILLPRWTSLRLLLLRAAVVRCSWNASRVHHCALPDSPRSSGSSDCRRWAMGRLSGLPDVDPIRADATGGAAIGSLHGDQLHLLLLHRCDRPRRGDNVAPHEPAVECCVDRLLSDAGDVAGIC